MNRYFKLDANLTLSRNKAVNYTAYIDTYDNPDNWNPVPQKEMFFEKTNLILSPEIVGMAMVSAMPGCGWNLSLQGKYVGEQFMDNFNSENSKVPGYFVSSFNVSKDFDLGVDSSKSKLNIGLAVDNLFNNKYYSYGWVYQAWFADGSAPYVEQGIYPQAPINFMLKIGMKF